LEVTTADSRAPARLEARIEASGPIPRLVAPGEWIELRLRLTNDGNTIWLANAPEGRGTVAVGGHLLSIGRETLVWDLFRNALSTDVLPQQATDATCRFRAPEMTGLYIVQIDLVAEGLAWFAEHGSKMQHLDIEVR
jgi:hypothetical protein